MKYAKRKTGYPDGLKQAVMLVMCVLISLFPAFFFAGCPNPLSPPAEPVAGANTLMVQIGGESPASRTALPSDAPVSATYNIRVIRRSGATAIDLGQLTNVTAGAGPYLVPLTDVPQAGDIVGVVGRDGGGVKNAEGISTLPPGYSAGTSVSITLYPTSEGTGNVDLSVNFPAFTSGEEITAAEVSLYQSLADYQSGNFYDSTRYRKDSSYGAGTDFAVGSPKTIPINHPGIPSGNYVVQIDFLRKHIRVSRLVQTIIVRDGLTTNSWDGGGNTLDWGTDKFASSNAEPNDITIDGTSIKSGGSLPDAFSKYKPINSLPLPPPSVSLTISPEAGQNITVSLNGGTPTSGGSHILNMQMNQSNSIVITVTASDGVTRQTYTVSYTYHHQTVWYVAGSGGNDSNNGTSPTTALATVGAALTKIKTEYNCGAGWPGGSSTPVAARIKMSSASGNIAEAVSIQETANLYDTLPPILLTGTGTGVTTITPSSGRPLTINKAAVILGDGLTLTGGTASEGGGVKVESGGSFIMNGGSIHANNGGNNGGGVYVTGSGSSFTMNGGAITDNTVPHSNQTNGGGGVAVKNSGSFILNGGTISGNKTTNSHQGVGGGVYVTGSSFIMNGGNIDHNEAENNANGGGGVAVASSGSFTMNGGAIGGNNKGQHGGGVYIDAGTFTLVNGTISGNTATDNDKSGGVFVYNSGDFFMKGGTVSGNIGNGVVMRENGSTEMEGGSVSGNTGSGVRIGVETVSGGSFTLAGGTISGNTENGVYFSNNGSSFTMKDGAVISQDNDVWLAGGKKIEIMAPLTGTPPAARITPETYLAGTPVLSGGYVLLNHMKFTVTQQSSGMNWTIDFNGNLQQQP
ncbi:MAG: cadherin-like beta sandwich domain-containing protein [Treponema sp.]|jgi:hypothetical protein|nr:cadherin-like beta sandwich domain-containing protein [Treponema sp.]